MFSISKFNKVTFDIDTTNFEYCKLQDLYDEKQPDTVFAVDGLMVHNSPLGDSPVIICAELGKLVNIPAHKAATFRDILQDEDAITAIKEGKVGFKIYQYTDRLYKRTCYSINFVDIKPSPKK